MEFPEKNLLVLASAGRRRVAGIPSAKEIEMPP
jgi:hypothetical protein